MQKFLRSKNSEPSFECAIWVHIMFWSQILKEVAVQAILSNITCLVWYRNAILKKLRGAKLVAPEIDFYFFRARSAFLARAKFLRQPLVTYKTFSKNRFLRMFLICSQNALVKMGLDPPFLAVVDTFVLA